MVRRAGPSRVRVRGDRSRSDRRNWTACLLVSQNGFKMVGFSHVGAKYCCEKSRSASSVLCSALAMGKGPGWTA